MNELKNMVNKGVSKLADLKYRDDSISRSMCTRYKVGISEIMLHVGVSEEQVNMALYSGRLPSPDLSGEWNFDEIKEILDRWKQSVDNKRARLIDEQVGNNYQSANMIIPKHTR